MCNCTRHVHSFACYMRNIATVTNWFAVRTASDSRNTPNAR